MKLFGYVYKIDKYKKIRVKITDEDKSKQSLETLEEFEQEFVTKVCDIIDSNEDLEFKIPIDSDYKTFVINPKKNTRYRGDNDEYMQKSDLIGQYCKFTVTIKEFFVETSGKYISMHLLKTENRKLKICGFSLMLNKAEIKY